MRNVKQNVTNVTSSKELDEQKCVTLYKKNGHQGNGETVLYLEHSKNSSF